MAVKSTVMVWTKIKNSVFMSIGNSVGWGCLINSLLL